MVSPSAPARGVLSMRRTPFSSTSASALSMPLVAKAMWWTPSPRFSINLATLGTRGLEKFDLRVAHFEECGANLLVGDLFDVVTFESQHVFVVGDGFFEILYGDAEVLDV